MTAPSCRISSNRWRIRSCARFGNGERRCVIEFLSASLNRAGFVALAELPELVQGLYRGESRRESRRLKQWAEVGYVVGQKRRKVDRLQRRPKYNASGLTTTASTRLSRRIAKPASISLLVLACRTSICRPMAEAASRWSATISLASGFSGLTSVAKRAAPGINSCNKRLGSIGRSQTGLPTRISPPCREY